MKRRKVWKEENQAIGRRGLKKKKAVKTWLLMKAENVTAGVPKISSVTQAMENY